MYLSVLRYVFKSNSKKQFTDLNKVAENFFKKILNITLDRNFQNLNEIQNNYPAIDLGDLDAKICFQVTAENNGAKIKKTIRKFLEKKLEAKYDVLNMLIITSKKNYTTSFTGADDKLVFDQNNIWDMDDLLTRIEKLEPKKLEELHDFISYELTSLVKVFSPEDSLLRNAEQTINLPPKNGKLFLKKFDFEPHEHEGALTDLTTFYKTLTNDIPRNTREYLYTFMLKGKPISYTFSQRILLNAQKIESFLNISRDQNRAHFNILMDERIGDHNDDGSDDLHVGYTMTNDIDLLSLFKEQFSDSEDLKDLIVNCNFTKLDE